MIPDLVRLFVSTFVEAPRATLVALYAAGVAVARKVGLPDGLAWLGPFAVMYALWRARRSKLAIGLLVGVWVLALWAYPDLRFAFGVAIPVASMLGGLVWLAQRYPQHPPHVALRYAVMEARQREVLSDAVPVSAGEGARVVKDSVHVAADGSFDAEIIGPAGVSHADLLEALRLTLAETVYAMSGRKVEHMSFVGAGPKGRVKVRGATVDPYKSTMTLDDLRGRQ